MLDPGLATILQFLRFCYLCILVTKILRGGPGPEKLGESHSRRTPINDFSASLASSEPLFFRFFHLQKITKKTTSEKSFFFRFGAHLGSPLVQFSMIWGSPRGPKDDIFTYFFGHFVGLDFGAFVLKQMKNK